MKKLYCPECTNYLLAGDGEMHDCCCGWTQPKNDNEISCWSCSHEMSYQDRIENDGFCPECNAEIEIET